MMTHLSHLFIEHWSSNSNYSAYVDQCSPSMCTYTTTDRTDLSYAITVFISLYGGLVIILRIVASTFIDTLVNFKRCSGNSNQDPSAFIEEFSCFHILGRQQINLFKSIKRLNVFKDINNRTEDDIKKQRITTRIYLVSLFSKALCMTLLSSRYARVCLKFQVQYVHFVFSHHCIPK